jgi:aconitate hydratase
LPLQFLQGEDAVVLGLSGRERYAIGGIAEGLAAGGRVEVRVTTEDGRARAFTARVRIDTPNELDYYRNGGILQFVLRQLANRSKVPDTF